MEEARPFPKMSSPPESTSSSPIQASLELGGLGPDHGLRGMEDDMGRRSTSPESGVHPGARVFNWSSPAQAEEARGSEGGPVSLTNMTQLTPISPSNEDVHSAEQYRQPQPPLIKYSTMSAFPGVWGYPMQTFQPAVFTMPENEKYRKMMLKKQKRYVYCPVSTICTFLNTYF